MYRILRGVVSLTLLLLGLVQCQAGPAKGAPYTYLSYGEIVKAVKDLAKAHPDFVELTTAQDVYDLQSPGTCQDENNHNTPCLQYILRITDKASLPDPERPEVFLSGELHGNERVGPLAVLATAQILVKAAACVKTNCQDSDIPLDTLHWLASLVRTRDLYVMPMANPKGYNDNRREENNMDPNRDFPYQQDPAMCMRTLTARALNELWRDNIFQLAVTFHGGMEAITYEWGSPNHPAQGKNDISPDDTAQAQIAATLSAYAGHFPGTMDYPYGRINDLVYPVSGGMEDWAYAASWDPENVPVCQPDTYGGYAAEKTKYNDVSLRAFNILVEASDAKVPLEETLGNDLDLWHASGEGSGHVTRNIRLSLTMLDMVEPYVSFPGVPLGGTCLTGCEGPTMALDPQDGGLITNFKWRVGGAMKVDETQVLWGPWPATTPTTSDSCAACNGEALIKAVGEAGVIGKTSVQSGDTRWHAVKRALQIAAETNKPPPIAGLSDPIFQENLDLSSLAPGDYFLVVRTRVDQDWAHAKNPHPDLGPQSHVINARTNPDWHMTNNGHVVRGRLDWYSAPIKLTIPAPAAAPEPKVSEVTTPPQPEAPATTPEPPPKEIPQPTAPKAPVPEPVVDPAAAPAARDSTVDQDGDDSHRVVNNNVPAGHSSTIQDPDAAEGKPSLPQMSTIISGFFVTVGLVFLVGFVAFAASAMRRANARRTAAQERQNGGTSGHVRGVGYTPVSTDMEMARRDHSMV